jgi:hypothetical protein
VTEAAQAALACFLEGRKLEERVRFFVLLHQSRGGAVTKTKWDARVRAEKQFQLLEFEFFIQSIKQITRNDADLHIYISNR